MIEKKLVEALEPLVDQLVAVEKKIASIELTPGPKGLDGEPGKDADPEAVASIVIEKYADALRGDVGAPGAPGRDGEDGRPGADSDPVAVAEILVEKHGDLLRGRDGIGIKSVKVDPDRKSLTLTFDNDQEAEIELPEGPQGSPGAPGRDGVDGLGFDAKAWAPGVYRGGSWVSTAAGKIYRAECDTFGVPGKSDEWERIGPWGFEWKGLKKADSVYENGDLYIDGGTTFLWFNGKGHMFAQRGAAGAKGEPGKDGKDAPHFVGGAFTLKGAALVMSDGSVLEAPIEGIEKAIENAAGRHAQDVWEAAAQQIIDEGGTPIRSFRGQIIYGSSYSVGDVVNFNKALWICRKANKGDMAEENWRRVMSQGGANAGGTPSFTSLITAGKDMDLSVGALADRAFAVYRASDKKFVLNYVDPFATNPLSAFSAADDVHVPTSQNVQQFVNEIGNLLQDQINAMQSGITHQIGVLSIANAPPATPTEGDRYIVDTAPTGAFATHAGAVAEYALGVWQFQTPSTGDAHFVDDRGLSVVWSGTAWVPLSRQNKTSLQATAPLNPLPGDCWLDNSGNKLIIKYWDGSSWITEAGTKTFTGPTDPATVPANGVKDGDVWVQTFPAAGTPPVTPTPKTQVRQGGAWTNTTPSIPASSRVYYQNTQPVGATLGDIWVDGSKSKLQVSYFDGTSWQNEAGTKTFTQPTDPALLSTVVLQDGDVWVQTFPADATGHVPTPVTKVRQGGGWTTTTPTVPASSRTFIQHVQPVGSVLGDQWIDLTGTKPAVQYFDGHAWVDSGGTRSFTSPTDPVLNAANTIQEGDIWTDNTDPKAPKIYQRTGGNWILMNGGGSTFVPEAPPAPVRGVWFKRFTPTTTPNDATNSNGMWNNWNPGDVCWSTVNQARYCPVPSKYRTGTERFKITVSYRGATGMRLHGPILQEFYFEEAGSGYYKDSTYIYPEDDNVAGFSCFFAAGNSDSMTWLNIRLRQQSGGTVPRDCIGEVEVMWELLNV